MIESLREVLFKKRFILIENDFFHLFYFRTNNYNTKDDYLSIFFDSENYREGIARILYKKYLFKEPTTTKLYDLTSYYNQTNNYKDIQKYILSSDEYVYY